MSLATASSLLVVLAVIVALVKFTRFMHVRVAKALWISTKPVRDRYLKPYLVGLKATWRFYTRLFNVKQMKQIYDYEVQAFICEDLNRQRKQAEFERRNEERLVALRKAKQRRQHNQLATHHA